MREGKEILTDTPKMNLLAQKDSKKHEEDYMRQTNKS